MAGRSGDPAAGPAGRVVSPRRSDATLIAQARQQRDEQARACAELLLDGDAEAAHYFAEQYAHHRDVVAGLVRPVQDHPLPAGNA